MARWCWTFVAVAFLGWTMVSCIVEQYGKECVAGRTFVRQSKFGRQPVFICDRWEKKP